MLPTSRALTSTLCGAPSPDSTLVRAMPAARVTAVGAPPGCGAFAPVLRILMMRPQRRAFMPGKACRQSRTAANSLRSMSCCQTSSVISTKGPRCDVPALLTSTSICPSALSAPSNAARQPPAVATSAAIVITLVLALAAICALASSKPCCMRATIATLAPASAKLRAMAKPMPLLPPVTRALRPFMRNSITSSSCSGLVSPALEIGSAKRVVVEFGIAGIEAVDARGLAGTEHLVRIKAVNRAHEPLTAQDLVAARNATGKCVGGIEYDAVAVGHHRVQCKDRLGDGAGADRASHAFE